MQFLICFANLQREGKMAREAKQRKRPTTSKELFIKKLVEDVGIEDEVFEIYGPTRIAGSIAWELWVYDHEEQIATRFVEEVPGESPRVYDTFQQLAVEIDIGRCAARKCNGFCERD